MRLCGVSQVPESRRRPNCGPPLVPLAQPLVPAHSQRVRRLTFHQGGCRRSSWCVLLSCLPPERFTVWTQILIFHPPHTSCAHPFCCMCLPVIRERSGPEQVVKLLETVRLGSPPPCLLCVLTHVYLPALQASVFTFRDFFIHGALLCD